MVQFHALGAVYDVCALTLAVVLSVFKPGRRLRRPSHGRR